MTEFVRFALLGLGAGAVYSLTALGIVLVYRGSGVVNFAQGAIGMVGAFIFYNARASGSSNVVAWIDGACIRARHRGAHARRGDASVASRPSAVTADRHARCHVDRHRVRESSVG